MGQPMQVLNTTVVDAIAMFATDRGVTGQEGVSLARGDEAGEGFPSALAGEIFATDDRIEHAFVVSNQVVVRRTDGWDEAALGEVADVISGFFVFYSGAEDL